MLRIIRISGLALLRVECLTAALLTAWCFLVTTTCLASDKNTEQVTPSLVCRQDSFNAGRVGAGTEINHAFKLINVGRNPLTLNGAYVSCGCTVAKLRTKELPVGATTWVDVTMDTSLKFGAIDKQINVVSNDPVRPALTLHILATFSIRTKICELLPIEESYFVGNALFVMLIRARARMGQALYLADCALCHGKQEKGGIAISLMSGNLVDMVAAKRTISQGSEFSPSMPGFLKAYGGPLSDAQINSIIQYLKNENDRRHK